MRAVLAGEAGDGLTQRVQAWLVKRMSGSMQIESLWRFNAKFDPDGSPATPSTTLPSTPYRRRWPWPGPNRSGNCRSSGGSWSLPPNARSKRRGRHRRLLLVSVRRAGPWESRRRLAFWRSLRPPPAGTRAGRWRGPGQYRCRDAGEDGEGHAYGDHGDWWPGDAQAGGRGRRKARAVSRPVRPAVTMVGVRALVHVVGGDGARPRRSEGRRGGRAVAARPRMYMMNAIRR